MVRLYFTFKGDDVWYSRKSGGGAGEFQMDKLPDWFKPGNVWLGTIQDEQ